MTRLLKWVLVSCVLSTGACSSNSTMGGDLKVVFSPMYTSWDMEHRFQIPAVVKGASLTACSAGQGLCATDITWSASDDSLVTLAADPTTGGIMMTVASSNPRLMIAGPSVPVTITAQDVNGQSGTAQLNIVPSGEEDDWHDGALRYENGVDVRTGTATPNMMAACTNCHGPTATMRMFKDIAHTPEQIGGFSDMDLDNIIRKGVVPPGGYFDSNIISMDQWHGLHQWQMTDEELRGLIVYLRSLTPTPQQGTSNFGGQF
jgi:hypothetical protein